MNKRDYESTNDYKKSIEILKNFVREVLDGDIEKLRAFDFTDLTTYVGDIIDPDMYLITQTNVEVLSANFDVEHSYEIIGLFKWYWGGWNSTPNADVMQIVAKKWYEKYDAELIRISHDMLSFECRKLSENEAQILLQEIKNLSAEIIDCCAGEWLDHLMEKQSFTLWWD